MSNYTDLRLTPSLEAMVKAQSMETHHIDPPQTAYEKTLVQTFFPHYSPKTLISNSPKKYEVTPQAPTNNWKFPSKSSKCLDVPGISDDFYQNNLDWGKYFLGLNLDKVCYVYNCATNSVAGSFTHAKELSSLKWNPAGDRLACGNVESQLVLQDVFAEKIVGRDTIDKHSIFSMDWRGNAELTMGTHGYAHHYDHRSMSVVRKIKTGEKIESAKVCSICWHPGKSLFATGNNEDNVQVFDIRKNTTEPLFHYSHNGGVKALSWLPHSSLLLSGGGTGDRTLKVFDAALGKQICQQQITKQICSIQHLDSSTFAVGLGYDADKCLEENLQFWEYNSNNQKLKKLNETNHSAGRILNITKDPQSSELCTVSNRETLCFWKPELLESKKTSQKNNPVKPKNSLFSNQHSILR
jgi:WD40 repeat protein